MDRSARLFLSQLLSRGGRTDGRTTLEMDVGVGHLSTKSRLPDATLLLSQNHSQRASEPWALPDAFPFLSPAFRAILVPEPKRIPPCSAGPPMHRVAGLGWFARRDWTPPR